MNVKKIGLNITVAVWTLVTVVACFSPPPEKKAVPEVETTTAYDRFEVKNTLPQNFNYKIQYVRDKQTGAEFIGFDYKSLTLIPSSCPGER